MSLFLGDFKGQSPKKIKQHIMDKYVVSKELMSCYKIVVAWESENKDDYDGDSYFLLLNARGAYFEVRSSHDSCSGFEGQFDPEESPIEHLLSFRLKLPAPEDEVNEIKNFIKALHLKKEIKQFVKSIQPKTKKV